MDIVQHPDLDMEHTDLDIKIVHDAILWVIGHGAIQWVMVGETLSQIFQQGEQEQGENQTLKIN